MWTSEIRVGIDELAANESLYLLYQTMYEFKKAQKPTAPYIMARGDHRISIKVLKVLHIECAPVTSIAKQIVMAQNNRCLLVRHRDHH